MIVVVIPARLGSTRLPNKLILTDTGKPLLYHTIDRVLESNLTDVVFVATEDRAIYRLVQDYNNHKIRPVMTGPAQSGTERIANFVSAHFDDEHTIVNFQGDEPDLPGCFIDRLAELVRSGCCDVSTLASPLDDMEVASDRDVVKVVTDHNSNALWFSRYPIPLGGPCWLKHAGIYAYSTKFLRQLSTMTPTTARGESLEQLQWLQAGFRIKVLVDEVTSVGIDNRNDYIQFVARYKDRQCQPVSVTL